MSESTVRHPDPEILAAFIDGRLRGDERRAVVEHLDRCADCYEVFSETVRFQQKDEPRGQVVRPPRFAGRPWLWAAAAAAVVFVAILALPILRMAPERPVVTGADAPELRLSSAALVREMGLGEPPGATPAPWQGWPEGFGFAGGLDRETAAFRVGVRLVDLRMALREGDLGTARELVPELTGALEAAGIAAELDGQLEVAREAAALADADALGGTVGSIEAAAEGLLDPFALAFGKWAEAGRLAASAGDRELFLAPEFAELQDDLRDRELREPVARRVEEIAARTRGDLGPPEDMEALETLFRNLVSLH